MLPNLFEITVSISKRLFVFKCSEVTHARTRFRAHPVYKNKNNNSHCELGLNPGWYFVVERTASIYNANKLCFSSRAVS